MAMQGYLRRSATYSGDVYCRMWVPHFRHNVSWFEGRGPHLDQAAIFPGAALVSDAYQKRVTV